MAIKLGDLLANPKGGKFFPVCAEDGGPAVWQCDWIRVLWHPTAYNGEDARRAPAPVPGAQRGGGGGARQV